jgi:hypothetical protein
MTSPWKSGMLEPPADNQHVLCRRLPFFDPPFGAYYSASSGTYTPDNSDGFPVPDYIIHSWRPYP